MARKIAVKKKLLSNDEWALYAHIADPLMFSEFIMPLKDGRKINHYHYQIPLYKDRIAAACTGRYTGKTMAAERLSAHGLVNYGHVETLFIAADKNHLAKPLEAIISYFEGNKFLKTFLKSNKKNGSVARNPFYRISLKNNALLYGVLPGGNEGAGGASNIEGHHVDRLIIDEGSMISNDVAFKLSQAVNTPNPEKGHIQRWLGTPSEILGSPFQKRMESEVPEFIGHSYNFASTLNPEYTLRDYINHLTEYGGNVNTPGYRRFMLGKHAQFSGNVFNMEDYTACKYIGGNHPYYSYRTFSRKMLDKGDTYLQCGKVMENSTCTVMAIDVGSSSHTIILVFDQLDNKWWLNYCADLMGIADQNKQLDLIHGVAAHYDVDYVGVDLGGGGNWFISPFQQNFPEIKIIGVHTSKYVDIGPYAVNEVNGKLEAPQMVGWAYATSKIQHMLAAREFVFPEDSVFQSEMQSHHYKANGSEDKITTKHRVAAMKIFALTKHLVFDAPKLEEETEEEIELAVLPSNTNLFGDINIFLNMPGKGIFQV